MSSSQSTSYPHPTGQTPPSSTTNAAIPIPGYTALNSSSGYITVEWLERIMKENARLTQELENAKKDAKLANRAVRDLATWALADRKKLLKKLDEARMLNRQAAGGEEVPEETVEDGPVSLAGWTDLLAYINKNGVGGINVHNSIDRYAPSIVAQVDDLIEEERSKMLHWDE